MYQVLAVKPPRKGWLRTSQAFLSYAVQLATSKSGAEKGAAVSCSRPICTAAGEWEHQEKDLGRASRVYIKHSYFSVPDNNIKQEISFVMIKQNPQFCLFCHSTKVTSKTLKTKKNYEHYQGRDPLEPCLIGKLLKCLLEPRHRGKK